MEFSQVYSEEVFETRRIRAERSRFWAKIVSLALIVTIAAVIQTEPQLRLALIKAGADQVAALRGSEPSPITVPPPDQKMTDEGALALFRMFQEMLPGGQAAETARIEDIPHYSRLPGVAPDRSPGLVLPAPAEDTAVRINRPQFSPRPDGARFVQVPSPSSGPTDP